MNFSCPLSPFLSMDADSTKCWQKQQSHFILEHWRSKALRNCLLAFETGFLSIALAFLELGYPTSRQGQAGSFLLCFPALSLSPIFTAQFILDPPDASGCAVPQTYNTISSPRPGNDCVLTVIHHYVLNANSLLGNMFFFLESTMSHGSAISLKSFLPPTGARDPI